MSYSFVFVPLYGTVKAVQFVHTAAKTSASGWLHAAPVRTGDSGVAEIVQVPV